MSGERKSTFPMISVDEALSIVFQEAKLLRSVSLPVLESLGHVLAENIFSKESIPIFPTSIMDGYAVQAPIEPGVFHVQDRVLAGRSDNPSLTPGSVVYITTGARLPEGTNAVVKIEDTEATGETSPSASSEITVQIKVTAKAGSNVRQIGSDMTADELVLHKGTVIGPADIGLLATIGVTHVLCYRKPTVGVMSTGDELVDVHETPTGSQIRDSNRAAILSSLREEGIPVIDLGIIRDQSTQLVSAITAAARRCDVVITSGGVSMGDADLVKPTLKQLGQIHFGRLNMKPGKPTTFATVPNPVSNAPCLFFALPGNPVSCLVTKALLVDPAIKRMQGLSVANSLYPEVTVFSDSNMELDPERPEYHRVMVSFDVERAHLRAHSTGGQRSSRLLSMRSANALVMLPAGTVAIPAGTPLKALLLRPIYPSGFDGSGVTQQSSFPLTLSRSQSFPDTGASEPPVSTEAVLSGPYAKMYSEYGTDWVKIPIRVALLTVSDRASAGIYDDKSGPEMARLVREMPDLALKTAGGVAWPCGVEVVATAVVPDEPDQIQAKILSWTDEIPHNVDVILTSGGTGFGVRDRTPEAVKAILHREAPGIAQALLNEGLKHTPLAVLSRPVVGTRGSILIATLPGSVKAVRENIAALQPLIPRVVQLLRTGSCEHNK